MDKVGLSHILSHYASVLSSAPVQGPPSQPQIGQSYPPPVVLGCIPGLAIRQGLPVCSHFILPDTLKWMLLFSPLCRYGHTGQRCEGTHLGSHSKTKSGREPLSSSLAEVPLQPGSMRMPALPSVCCMTLLRWTPGTAPSTEEDLPVHLLPSPAIPHLRGQTAGYGEAPSDAVVLWGSPCL